MSTGNSLPANPFYASPEQRVALARQRFFEDGVRPSGMVSEAVIQSWSRCLRSHPDPARPGCPQADVNGDYDSPYKGTQSTSCRSLPHGHY